MSAEESPTHFMVGDAILRAGEKKSATLKQAWHDSVKPHHFSSSFLFSCYDAAIANDEMFGQVGGSFASRCSGAPS